MRVIAGSAKGTRLAAVPAGTRPVSDRAREGLFSSLGPSVNDARVLDLYAGTGALGIEALSRGAVSATFVDRSPAAIRTIIANLDKTHLTPSATVVRGDVVRFLRRPGDPVDLAFLDPPYDTPMPEIEAALTALGDAWLSSGATVCLTRPSRGYIPVIPVNWRVARRLSYGDSLAVLYREV
jgi:16S rRNA (guanine966-N2)-methyltransferase